MSQEQLDFDGNIKVKSLRTFTNKAIAACHWLKRSYETDKYWEAKATSVYVEAFGDDCLARTRLATLVRQHFSGKGVSEEDLTLWNNKHTELEALRIIPPAISDSNSAYVDWLFIADYLLLVCCGDLEAVSEINAVLKSQYRSLLQSYELRSLVDTAYRLLSLNPEISDEDLLPILLREADGADAEPSITTITEARRWLKSGEIPTAGVKPEEPRYISTYKALY